MTIATSHPEKNERKERNWTERTGSLGEEILENYLVLPKTKTHKFWMTATNDNRVQRVKNVSSLIRYIQFKS